MKQVYAYLLRLQLTVNIKMYYKFFFILSSEFNIVFSFTNDEQYLYFFIAANRGCFDNLGLNFFSKRFGIYPIACLPLWTFTNRLQSAASSLLPPLLKAVTTSCTCISEHKTQDV